MLDLDTELNETSQSNKDKSHSKITKALMQNQSETASYQRINMASSPYMMGADRMIEIGGNNMTDTNNFKHRQLSKEF